MKHLDLFSGIGGFALATEMVWGQGGVEHVFCDNEPFSQAILKKHWSNSKIYGDIRTLTADSYLERHLHGRLKKQSTKRHNQALGKSIASIGSSSLSIDLLTGGFPCQPFSQAGRRKGKEDDRFLWPEMLRVIKEFKPRWVVGENVAGLLSMAQYQSGTDMEGKAGSEDDNYSDENAGGIIWDIINDIEQAGYTVQTFVIPAVSLNAPHRRDRVWIVAHTNQDSESGLSEHGKQGQGKLGQPLVGHAEHHGFNGTQNRESGTARSNSNTQRSKQVQQSTRPNRQGNNATNSRQQHEQGNEQGVEADQTKRSTRTTDPERCSEDVADYNDTGLEGRVRQKLQGASERSARDTGGDWDKNWLEVATRLCTLDDGLPNGLARPRGWRNAALKGAGNAIVPQVAAEIFRAIKAVDETYGR